MKKSLTLTLSLLTMLGGTSAASAAVWDLNFGKVNPTHIGSGVAEGGDSGDVWQAPNATDANNYVLFDTTGALDGFVSFDADNKNTSTLAGLKGYATGLHTINYALTDNSSTYYVYLYTTSDAADVNLAGIGGTTLTADGSTTYNDGYVTYNVLKYVAGTMNPNTLTMGASGTGYFNAIQVEAVPEPSSVLLLGMGGLLGTIAVKRKQSVVQS